MQDRLLKLLEIKIDAINKNIDNLNYLNKELKENNDNLDYMKSKIELFNTNDVLNFDNIDSNDFEKIISMIDSSVSEVFKDKTCNYHGIMYIIQGIRQGISLELTLEQTNAIMAFIEGMKEKAKNLEDVIHDLEVNKERLPEVNLDTLNSDLAKYQGIISKIKDNLYLTEIDDITNVFEFSEIPVEEKVDMFEYILKYNANIYTSKKEVEGLTIEEPSLNEITVPEFHFDPINIELEANNIKDEIQVEEVDENLEPENLNPTNLNDYGTMQLPIINPDEMYLKEDMKTDSVVTNQDIKESELVDSSVAYDIPIQFDNLPSDAISNVSENDNTLNETPVEEVKEISETDSEVANLNTVDLEDIIKKIDAKLKEIEEHDKEKTNDSLISDNINIDEVPTNPNLDELTKEDDIEEDEVTDTALNEVFLKYNLSSENLKENVNKNAFEVDEILNILNSNNILDYLKQKEKLLNNILVNNNSNKLNELFSLIRENLALNDNHYQEILEIIIETMPSLLINLNVINSFSKNIEFYKTHQINLINLFDNYRELLIIDNELLIDNNLKIEGYGLSLNNDNVKYLLYNRHILKNLDYYIEAMGHEKGFLGKEDEFDGVSYITKHPYKLNGVSRDVLMKLRYSTENNLKIYGSKPGILAGEIANSKVDLLNIPEDYKNLYFDNQYGFIDRSEMIKLLSELDTTSEFDMIISENIQKLDSLYKKNDLRYEIEGIYFSRIKTIRLYNFLLSKNIEAKNALLIALTYNSVIKKDEYEKVVNTVKTLIEGGN